MTSSAKMDEGSDSDVCPYIERVLRNCKILDLLMALAGSMQVLTDNHVYSRLIYPKHILPLSAIMTSVGI